MIGTRVDKSFQRQYYCIKFHNDEKSKLNECQQKGPT